MSHPRHLDPASIDALEACEWFNFDQVDLDLMKEEGRLVMDEDNEVMDDRYATREECRALIQLIHFLLDKPDYRARAYGAVVGMDAPLFYGQKISEIAARCKVSERSLLLRIKKFKTEFDLSSFRVRETLIKFIAILLDSHNYRLRLDVAIAAIGMNAHLGMNHTALAKRNLISKQAFNKHIIKFQSDFRLRPTRQQKSLEVREVYRQVARKRAQNKTTQPPPNGAP